MFYLEVFINRFNQDNIARNFYTRTEIFNEKSKPKKDKSVYDLEGVSKSKVALVMASQYLHVFKNYLVALDMEEDIDFHISKYGDPWKSCYVFYSTKNMNNKQITAMNFV